MLWEGCVVTCWGSGQPAIQLEVICTTPTARQKVDKVSYQAFC